jgi:glycosyltransferase involved in cell wall biosynthesis
MISSLRVGIPFIGDKDWLGGVYYIESLIKAVHTLPKIERPRLFLIISESSLDSVALFQNALPLLDGILFLGHDISRAKAEIKQQIIHCPSQQDLFSAIDFFYPVLGDVLQNVCSASWIFDFQHFHLPGFFSSAEIQRRNSAFQRIAQYAKLVVFSSKDSENDFRKIFPSSYAVTRVLHFHTLAPDEWYSMNPPDVQKKYQLPDEFLICSNQFYTHKNHIRLFEALALMHKESKEQHLVCTGQTADPRAPGFFKELQQKIIDLQIENYVHILGIIPRIEQIQLMRRSLAVVQPSLFEGWSTVVEDARALGKTIFLSDLAVHLEQAPRYAVFFDRQNTNDLAQKIMRSLPDLSPGPNLTREEEARLEGKVFIRDFARQFCCIALEVQSLFKRANTEPANLTHSVSDRDKLTEGDKEENFRVQITNEINTINKLLELSKFEEANSVIIQAIEKYPDSPDVLNLQAILKLHINDTEGAKSILLDLIKRWPTYYPAYVNLALIFWNSGIVEQAISYFEDALRISQLNRSVVFSYGAMLMKLNKFIKAKELYEKYLTINSDDSEIRSFLQECESILGKVTKLSQVVKKAEGLHFRITSASDYIRQYPSEGTSFEIASPAKKGYEGKHLHMFVLNDFILAGPNGLPISRKGEVIKDRLINFNIENELSHIRQEEFSSILSDKKKGKFMPLYGDWAEGFWHWMIENLPAVILAENSGYDGFYIIPSVSHARHSIELLGVNSDRIIEYEGGHWHIETLYLPQRLNGWRPLRNYPDILHSLRKKLLDAVELSAETPNRRIYISRNKLSSQKRIVVNEDELLKILSPYSFDTVYMEQMSLKEQIALMSKANVLITPHGAGMVHTLFMPPQSLILELFTPTYINPTMLPTIDLLKHRYFMIPSYLNAPLYKSGGNIEAFLDVIEITLKRELGSVDAGKNMRLGD